MVRRNRVPIGPILGLAAAAAILAAIVFLGPGLKFQRPFAIAGGATVQSVDCDIPAGTGSLTGRKCFITVAVDKGAQRVTLGKEELSRRLTAAGDPGQFTGDISLDFEALPQQAQYEIVTTSPTLQGYSFGWIFKEGWEPNPGASIKCPETNLAYDFIATFTDYPWPSNDYTVRSCVYESPVGVWGNLQLKTIVTPVRVTASGMGGSASAEVSNQKLTSPLGSIGTVRMSGSLATFDQPPDPAHYAAFYRRSENRWRILTNDQKEDYRNKLDITRTALKTIRDECQPQLVQQRGFPVHDCRDGKTYVASFLDSTIAPPEALLRDIVGKTDLPIEFGGAQTELGKESGAKLLVPLDMAVGNPVVTLEVDAAWAGVITLAGKPDVSVAGVCSVQSGSPSSVAVVLRNIGSGPGKFSLTSNCDGNVGLSGFTGTHDLAAGASKTLQVSTTSGLTTGSARCEFTATDRGSGESDTADTACTITAPKRCTIGQMEVDGQNIMRCETVNGEIRWVVKQTCKGDEIIARTLDNQLSCQGFTETVERAEKGESTLAEELLQPEERVRPACDILCILGRISPIVWVILAVVVGGLVAAVVLLRRGVRGPPVHIGGVARRGAGFARRGVGATRRRLRPPRPPVGGVP